VAKRTAGNIFSQENSLYKPSTTLTTGRNVWTLEALHEAWRYSLQEKDRSAGTVKKYTQGVARFLAWYE
jgi:hypothetical protein